MSPSPERPGLLELLASLSLASDLGTGQALGHGLRTCLTATAIATELGCAPELVRTTQQVALLRFLGCTSDAAATARLVGGDEIAFNAAMGPVLYGEPRSALVAYVRAVGVGSPLHRRPGVLLSSMIGTAGDLAAHCEVAAMLARRLGLSARVVEALANAYERWDGKGPSGLEGDGIPLEVRIAVVARDADLLADDREALVETMRRRRGRAYAPDVVDAYLRLPPGEVEDDLEELVASEPVPAAQVDDLDRSLRVLADFVDLKSPWTRGHSPRVAELARSAALGAGLGAPVVREVELAGLVHDLGRVGVENGVWDKPGRLSTSEREKVALHPYLTHRILARSPGLAALGDLAACHHERLDGSGYHRRYPAAHLAPPARILAAADVYAALTADRPHRPRFDRGEARSIMEEEAAGGRLDVDAVAGVLAVAEGGDPPPPSQPDGLTGREVEVLTLLAAGRTNRQVGEELFISPKTVSRHVENIYAKIGVSTRAGAAVYAMEHRLLG
jgi:HD-GYP domain-containing protein (c-di-GMP phosphodiesterase class II)/DNA-binding CsgD family transcriptional regulator